MNLRSMIDEFRVRAMDTSVPPLWPDEELAPWFSEADKEASIRAKLIRDSDLLDVSAGVSAVDLPALLFDIQYAEIQFDDGRRVEISPTDRAFLDRNSPGWRGRISDPSLFMHDERRIAFNCVVQSAFKLYIEFFRTPQDALSGDSDVPEVADVHHIHLIDWVMFRAYSKADIDIYDSTKANECEGRFEQYFGKRPNADLRRRQNASRPHRNRTH